MWWLKRYIFIRLMSFWKVNYYRENVYIVNRHRWNGTMTMRKRKKLRSKKREIERTTSSTKTNIRKTCRCFSHLFYLSSVIIFRQNHLHFISGMRDVVTFFSSLLLLLFLDVSSFVVFRIPPTLVNFFLLSSVFFLYCTHIDQDWWFSFMCFINDRKRE